MPDKDKDNPDWAGKGFSKRNEESAPEKPDPDDESWVWE